MDYAVAGAAAFSGGVTGTLSPAIILFELTGQLHHALPVLLATLVARHTAKTLAAPFYDMVLRLAQLPVPPSTALAGIGRLPLSAVMRPPDHALPRRIALSELARQLAAFPDVSIFRESRWFLCLLSASAPNHGLHGVAGATAAVSVATTDSTC